jgi:hypothetical protein
LTLGNQLQLRRDSGYRSFAIHTFTFFEAVDHASGPRQHLLDGSRIIGQPAWIVSPLEHSAYTDQCNGKEAAGVLTSKSLRSQSDTHHLQPFRASIWQEDGPSPKLVRIRSLRVCMPLTYPSSIMACAPSRHAEVLTQRVPWSLPRTVRAPV